MFALLQLNFTIKLALKLDQSDGMDSVLEKVPSVTLNDVEDDSWVF